MSDIDELVRRVVHALELADELGCAAVGIDLDRARVRLTEELATAQLRMLSEGRAASV